MASMDMDYDGPTFSHFASLKYFVNNNLIVAYLLCRDNFLHV